MQAVGHRFESDILHSLGMDTGGAKHFSEVHAHLTVKMLASLTSEEEGIEEEASDLEQSELLDDSSSQHAKGTCKEHVYL